MSKPKYPIHYVSTLDEAGKLVRQHKKFWISNCGCREGQRNKCKRSRIDVCLYFTDTFGSTGTGFKRVNRAEVKRILKEAREKFLVSRPFRNPKKKNIVDGICFCCDCCCWYFTSPKGKKYRCDKGVYIEQTDLARCTACGSCVDVCYFEARDIKKRTLKINRRRCYGCGLCIEVCPEESILMVKRK